MIETPDLRFDPIFHRYYLGENELPSVTKILDSCGLISSWCKDEEAALRGSLAHLACRYLAEGRLDWSTVGTETMPYAISFDRWLEATQFQVEACEVMKYHPVFLFAGQYDLKGRLPKAGRYLLDYKTSVACARWHEIQTSLYDILETGHHKRGCLHLQKSGAIAKFFPHRDPSDRANAMSCLNVYRLKEAA